MSAEEKASFAGAVTELYATKIATTTGHVAVTIRDRTAADLYLGRAVEGPLPFVDAEIRQGRQFERKRAFALTIMEHAAATFDIPEENMKVVFTEHTGESLMGANRVGGEWDGE